MGRVSLAKGNGRLKDKLHNSALFGREMVARAKIIVKDNPAQLAQTGANLFTKVALASVKERGRFAVAVSGGSTPRLMHQMLAEEPHRTQAPWDSISFFWVDERCVPITDESSNYGIAKQDLLDRVPIPKRQIHPMPVEVPPHKGAVEYEKVLQDFFQSAGEQIPEFDMIFLGIGADGHTASLFPGQNALVEKKQWVAAVKGGNPDVHRLTMTYPLINRANQIVILVSGKGRASIMRTLFEEEQTGLQAKGIRPTSGALNWLVDRDAARKLSKEVIHGEA